jgi:dienelactone hydrolase
VRLSVAEYYHAMATETDFSPRSLEELRRSVEEHEQLLILELAVPPAVRERVKMRMDSLLAEPSLAVRDAPPAPGSFPLVLHLPGYNGSSSHHYPLLEYLASYGYVVASIPSMGMYARTIDDEPRSLDVQARDLEFVYSVLRTLPFVDAKSVGTTGMSWGGMSNVLFASRNAYVDAAVTLDGAITMPEEISLIERIPGYRHRSFRAAYLQLLVAPEEADFRPKDLRFWNDLRYSDALSVQFSGVGHDAFSPGLLRLRNLTEPDPGRVRYLEAFARAEMEYARRFFDATLRSDAEARSSLPTLGNGMGLPEGLVASVEVKRAERAPPSLEEFAAIVRTRGAAAAALVFQEARAVDPEVRLIVSSVMGPLYMEAMEKQDLAEALAICELWASGLPEDPGPVFSMARVYRTMGDTARAIEAYERILGLVPEGPLAQSARRALEELRGKVRPHDPTGLHGGA